MDLTDPLADTGFWAGRKVLVTGHTGFKGSWLSLWLQEMGAQVHGLALAAPTHPALFEEARVASGMDSAIGDIREFEVVRAAVQRCKPDVMFHLAAQALVRESYANPLETYATNVMGTAHVLEACRHAGSVRAVVCVTSDKCYDNRGWSWGYREDEALGGADPYSSSKACAELVTAAYRKSWLGRDGIAVATARAGNVIGGGDWATDRLVPDAFRAFGTGVPLRVRNPAAIRPWQHVLDPLAGYLLLAQRLREDGAAYAESWNFGPWEQDARRVDWVAERLASLWAGGAGWSPDASPQVEEAQLLKLDAAKSRARLRWMPRWRLGEALERTVAWQQAWLARQDMRAFTVGQINAYLGAGVVAS